MTAIRSAIRPAIRGAAYSPASNPGAGGGYSAEANALFARFTVPPSAAAKDAYDTVLIKPLKAAGLFEKLDCLHVWDTLDAQWSRQNVIQDAHNASFVGSPTHTPKSGVTGNGSSSYADLNYNPGDGGSHKFAQNDGSIGIWSLTNAAQTTYDIGARVAFDTQNASILARVVGDQAWLRMNSVNPIMAANTNSTGKYHGQRTGAAAFELFKNGSSAGTDSGAGAAPANLSMFLCAVNNNGSAGLFTTRQYAASWAGASLSSGEISSLNTILDNWHSAIGAIS